MRMRRGVTRVKRVCQYNVDQWPIIQVAIARHDPRNRICLQSQLSPVHNGEGPCLGVTIKGYTLYATSVNVSIVGTYVIAYLKHSEVSIERKDAVPYLR